MHRTIIYLILLITIASSFSCNGTKHLSTGEKLYTGAEIELEPDDAMTRREKRNAKSNVKSAIRPEPNKTFLGMRPKLWMYMAAGESPKGKFKKWLRRRGEAPVLMSDVKPSAASEIVDANLFNSGIFNASTQFRIDDRKNTSKVIYTSRVHKPYTFSDLKYFIKDDSLSKLIIAEKGKSFISPGEKYNLDHLKNERIRIDELLKNNGYFYFNPDYLLFKADTSEINKTVTLTLSLKDSIPENALNIYRINKVFIDQDFSLTGGLTEAQDTVSQYEGTGMKIKPGALARSIHLRKNEIYSRRNHNTTLSRLMSMGNFKYVNVRFSEIDTSASGYMNVSILMTPMLKHTFSAEIDMVSKSNNFTGPRMNLSYLDRNFFKGAELLKINLAGSYEAQLSGNNLYSYSWNPQVEIVFPRFLVPFDVAANRRIIPKTRLSFSYNYMKRVNYFDMRQFNFTYGFTWKENIRTEHELDPVNISYTSIGNRSPAFTELLDTNPYLRKSYEEQFIAGSSYSYTYNEQMLPDKQLQFFFQFTSELAGNAISLVKIIAGEEVSSENPSRLARSIYSQYARFSIDGRSYYNFPTKNKFAMRLFAGVAAPYGNSSSLPYTRQFFSGGPNSIRAFRINSVGPGTIQPDTVNDFLQSGGEIKFEMNAEYRFNIYRFFKGALFIDAGNVWLHKSNPANTGSPFSFSSLRKDFAMGAGVGLRLDFSFVILRFDLATPLRKPWLEESNKWVIDRINFGSSAWRRENLILNIAIGHPF